MATNSETSSVPDAGEAAAPISPISPETTPSGGLQESKGSETTQIPQTEDSPSAVIGIDLGTSTAVVALLDFADLKPDILRNLLSNQETPVSVTFADKRHFGEDSQAIQTSKRNSTFTSLIRAIGKSKDHFVTENASFSALPSISATEEDQIKFTIQNRSGELELNPEQLLASYISILRSFAPANIKISCSIVIPESFSSSQITSIFDACRIAEVDCQEVIYRTTASAVANATRKSTEQLDGKNILYVDIGHGYASAAVYSHEDSRITHVASKCSETFGSGAVDGLIFQDILSSIEEKYKQKVDPVSKGGIRLRREVKKVKETLSSVTATTLTCENLVNDQDVSYPYTRERLEEVSAAVGEGIRQMITQVVGECTEKGIQINVCELVGGGMRIPFVKRCIESALESIEAEDSTPLGLSYTLDSMASCCVGAGYNVAKALTKNADEMVPTVVNSHGVFSFKDHVGGMTESQISDAIQIEQNLSGIDARIAKCASDQDTLEGYILETKALVSGNRTHSALVLNKETCLQILTAAEDWLMETEVDGADPECDVYVYTKKLKEIETVLQENLQPCFDKAEELEAKCNDELKNLSDQAAKELKESGGKEDHDFRKLSKADRMKKVLMNKAEGTELFKGGVIEPALLRYKRALQHCEKFFDLNEEGKKEVDEVTLSLYLNLSMCQIKLDQLSNAFDSLNLALKIDDECVKAIYRRAMVLEKQGKFDAAKADLIKAEKLNPGDKAVARLMLRVEAQIKRQIAKQKKMAQKMFS